MEIIEAIQKSCQIKNVVVEYCKTGYFSKLIIKPIYFRVYTTNGVEWGIANSISIEEKGFQYEIFCELDGMTVAFFETAFIEKIQIDNLKNDDFRQMRREYYDIFKE